jgi:hypothetical protein
MAEDSNFEVTTTTCHAFLLSTLMVIPSIPIATTNRSSRGFELITSRGLLSFYFSSSLAPDQPDDEQQNDCTDRGADDLAGDASDGDIAG